MLEGSCHCGAVHWRMDRMPESATACNCTVCRRYGVLWAYDWLGEAIHVSGATHHYRRADGGDIEFHFCPTCSCNTWWQGHKPHGDGRTRIAVNLRLAEPDTVATIPIRHFDGLGAFQDLPSDGKCVADLWA